MTFLVLLLAVIVLAIGVEMLHKRRRGEPLGGKVVTVLARIAGGIIALMLLVGIIMMAGAMLNEARGPASRTNVITDYGSNSTQEKSKPSPQQLYNAIQVGMTEAEVRAVGHRMGYEVMELSRSESSYGSTIHLMFKTGILNEGVQVIIQDGLVSHKTKTWI